MWNPGDEIGPWMYEVSREQLVRYAGASDDFNPIHYDDTLARKFGLPGVIVHGMLNMGIMGRFVVESFGAGSRLTHYSVRFRNIVQPGEELLIRGRIRERKGSQLTIDVNLAAAGAKPAITGRLIVKIKEEI